MSLQSIPGVAKSNENVPRAEAAFAAAWLWAAPLPPPAAFRSPPHARPPQPKARRGRAHRLGLVGAVWARPPTLGLRRSRGSSLRRRRPSCGGDQTAPLAAAERAAPRPSRIGPAPRPLPVSANCRDERPAGGQRVASAPRWRAAHGGGPGGAMPSTTATPFPTGIPLEWTTLR